ncbi:flagellin FliC3 [Kineothrix sp. MSJ-39]|uniref:flagellin N-terminal helical domain-containing protein n=1 Tax=Kineothrix sp. MSJ-39 TaxID=2841533 RepID=UPI001C123FB5|nr:flagellin [Kineothrix sp. MSJ-39]MBU5429042.1 flagellin FliC3 [Kineothrix sp. MSJ-39]
MKINYNVSAVVANAALTVNEKKFNVSTERLSTGYKVNHAKENPSGIAIAKRMNAQLKGLSQSKDNASTAVSVVSTAEGALTEIQSMIQRMNELSVQAATGTKTDSDRESIQAEIKELKEEIERMKNDTEFNGKKLLNGDCDLKGYADAKGIKVSYYSDETPVANYKFSLVNPIPLDQDGNVDLKDGSVTLLQDGSENAFPKDAKITYDGDKVTVTAANEFEITFQVDKDVTKTSQDGSISLDITGIGAMRVQIGANEGQVLAIRIPEVSLDTLGLSDIDISTQEGAQRAMDLTKQANAYISTVRSRIGAYENRLEHTQSSLGVTEENVTSAFSRIMDTDMAEEMTEYANQQVLNQAGISVLTQANQRPAEVLQLLQ